MRLFVFCGRKMTITLNGETRDVPDGLTVRGLLNHLDIQGEKVAVERNLEIVRKAAYDSTRINDGDSLEVVSFMAGGCGPRADCSLPRLSAKRRDRRVPD